MHNSDPRSGRGHPVHVNFGARHVANRKPTRRERQPAYDLHDDLARWQGSGWHRPATLSRQLAISLRGRGTTECRLRLNELTSHNEENMKAFKAWVRDFVKSSLKSCDSAKLLQAQNAKLRQPHRRFEAQQGANKKHKGNNNKSQQASAASSIGPEVLDDQE